MAEIWWNANLAAPAETYWMRRGLVPRGEFGGRCNHPGCQQTGADWYNRSSGKHYCDDCARAINEMCLQQGERKLCELHF